MYVAGTGKFAPFVPFAFSKSIRQVARDLVNSTVFWASSYDGLFKSTDSGATYTKVTAAGLPPAYMNFTSVSPANPLNLFAVGGGSFYSSTSGGLVWNRITAIPHIGFGGGHIVKPTTSGTSVYAATPSGGVYKSNDNGATWGQLSIPSLMTGSVGPIGRLRIRAQDDSTVYLAVGANGLASAGGGSGPQYDDRFDRNKVGLYKTINGGATWTTLSIGTTGVVSFGRPVGAVNAMDIAPGSPSTLVAATGIGIFKSTDTGANWRLVGPAVVYAYTGVSTASLTPSAPGVGAVRYDPLNANNLIATSWDIDNYGRATALSALYRSRDGGETWQAMATYEKVGSGFAFVTTNGRTVPYVTSGGYFDDAPSANLIFRCPDLFTVSDPNDMKCAPARVETTADGVPGSFAQTVVANIAGVNQLIGVSAVGLGMQVVRRTNIGPDFNNDGVADVLWRNTGAGGQNFIWRMEKAASNRTLVHQTESAFLPTVPTDWVIGGYGDFNGDGNTDILWRNTTTGDTYIYLMDGATVLAGSGYSRNVPTAWSPVGVEDFDGDGKADILWRNGTTGDTYFYLMNGLTISGEGYGRNVPLAWSVAGVGDFNGDGKADILWRNGTTGDTYFYLMNGMTIVSEGYGRNVPTAWNVAGTRDLNGDGKFDILWRNGGTGDNYVYFMNGLSISSEGYLPTVADPNWVIKGIGNYTNDTAARGILWSNATTRLNFLWRMNGTGLNIDGACSTLGCDNNANYLPSAPAGWAIIK